MKIIILIPIYNDWQSATKLLENINNEVSGIDHTFSIILVNDASTEQITENLSNFSNLNSVQILNLKQNIGHARCIATGLNHIIKNEEFDYVIPMDGDGEDRPEEIKLFIENFNYHPNKTIVGERVKRSESILFKLCYSFHKILTYTFTGQSKAIISNRFLKFLISFILFPNERDTTQLFLFEVVVSRSIQETPLNSIAVLELKTLEHFIQVFDLFFNCFAL